jgi:rRNA maturation RNase YbeY
MLNHFKLKYFNEDVITDIVTFPIRNDSELEAEIYISPEMASHNAKEFKVSLNNEISRLIVHGVLHLIGFDDSSEEKKKVMFKKQEQILSNYNKQLCHEI